MKHYSERKRGSEAFIERCYNMISTIDTLSTYGRLKFQYMAALVRIESLYSGLPKTEKDSLLSKNVWCKFIEKRFDLPDNDCKKLMILHIRELTKLLKTGE